MKASSSWVGLWVCVALFIGLGVGYDTLTPVFEQSDETLHYPYARHMADGQGLPLAIPGQLWGQEGTQPPLYYAIVAASTFWIDSDNLPDLRQRNPHWQFTEVRALINDNQNVVLHGPMDAFPYRGAALAVHIGRWWSLLFGAATVMCVYGIGQHLFPKNPMVVLTAVSLTAFNPQFVRVSATMSNDSLSALLASLSVLLALVFTAPLRQRWGWHNVTFPALLGLCLGLAILTKLSSLGVLGVVLVIIGWRLLITTENHDLSMPLTLLWLGMLGLVISLVTGWWFYRNYALYGEWLATETHLNLAGRADLSLGEVLSLRAETMRAYWATFGWGQIRPPEWVYQGLFWFGWIAALGVMVGVVARLFQGTKSKPLPVNVSAIKFDALLLLSLWAGLSLMLYFRWVMEVGSVSHTRLMFPAIAAISLLLAVGWHTLIPQRGAAIFAGAVFALLLSLNVYSLGWLLRPAFQPPSVEPTAQTLDITFVDALKLTDSTVESVGDTVFVTAQWEVVAPLEQNYSVAVSVLAPDGRVLGQRETYPGLGLRPTRYLEPGRFGDVYPVRLAETVTEPIVAQVAITLFDVESAAREGFPALDAAGEEITPFVGAVKLVPRDWPVYAPDHAAEVDFNGEITLIGYDLGAGLTLYWEAQQSPAADYVVFVHLLDAEGHRIAQGDGPPTYPTAWWESGEIIADRRLLPADADTLYLGLYHPGTGERLPILESTLPVRDHGIEIGLP